MNIKSLGLYSSIVALCFSQLAQALPLVSPVTTDTVYTQKIQIGKVFHDQNRNGIQDANEEGIPGVRLATVTGLVVETDGYGRFHLIESNKQPKQLNHNIVIKLDIASLPQGARLTTENPRVIRSLNSGASKVNFGVFSKQQS